MIRVLKKSMKHKKNQNTKKLTSVLVSGEVREPLCRGGEPIKESWEKWFLAEINKQYLIKTGTQATSESERKFYWKLAFFLKKKCGRKARTQSEIGSRLVAFYTVSARCQLWIMSINQNCHKLVPILFFQLFQIWVLKHILIMIFFFINYNRCYWKHLLSKSKGY